MTDAEHLRHSANTAHQRVLDRQRDLKAAEKALSDARIAANEAERAALHAEIKEGISTHD